MVNKNCLKLVYFIMVCILLMGCSSTPTKEISNVSQESTVTNSEQASTKTKEISSISEQSVSTNSGQASIPTKAIQSLTVEDLDVHYKGLTINNNTSLKEMADKLKIPIGKDNENIDCKASGQINGEPYNWYVVHYPDKKKEEITIEYVCNENSNTGNIVFVDLKETTTRRGIVVGDNIEKVKSVYGKDLKPQYDTENTNYIDFKINNYSFSIIYEKSTGKVTRISIDYDTNSVMDKMGIPAFD